MSARASGEYTRPDVKRRLLVIGTGGTIASEPSSNGYTPLRNDHFYRRIRQHPLLSDPSGTSTPTLFSSPVLPVAVGVNTRYPELITPPLGDNEERVSYEILDLDKQMDSSEMTPSEWNIIAGLVEENWTDYDGFIILSGTDTLAYTSSILSFLFTNIGKPILVTGAQIPLSQPRSDGWANLLDSIYVAGVMNFAGIGVVFHHQVFQGNRATKTSPNHFAAFQSPCVPPLVNLNVKITLGGSITPRSSTLPPRLINLVTSPTVLSCSIHPGITGALLSAQIEAVPTCKAVILSAYGSGNLPISEENGALAALEAAVKRDILVVVISQCAIPNVYPLYTQGRTLLSKGVLPGHDLTHEAAFAKLLWLVSRKDLSFRQRQELFEIPIAGEMAA
ncbi:putative asparaginase [Kockovaella imperatae]|uniref:asparaginase n=1 Tax=Kockovaella imperatae TaxID=4999 RepID=A0A1Y1US90_9TREE|nr:putative asparaginase [Kockovaella imperatae]ORX40891.1 putative asparaginase [Kockovaella imperatae]